MSISYTPDYNPGAALAEIRSNLAQLQVQIIFMPPPLWRLIDEPKQGKTVDKETRYKLNRLSMRLAQAHSLICKSEDFADLWMENKHKCMAKTGFERIP
ncbi:MAG: hypothetical protein AAF702_01600 [Chloroflexota bacterium]